MTDLLSVPPGPRQRPIVGSLLDFRRDPLSFLEGAAAEYGKVSHFRFFRRPAYLIADPELTREVLVTRQRSFVKSLALQRARVLLGDGLLTSEHELHLRQRRMIQPSFHRERIERYGEQMVGMAERAGESWVDGEEVDIAPEMNRLTLAITARTLLGVDVGEGEADQIGTALTDALGLFDRLTNPFAPILDRLPVPSTRRLWRARDRLDHTIHSFIAERRRDPAASDDLLSALILAQDDEDGGATMSDTQLRDEVLTIFLAGHETTANALAWTWVLLARSPQAEGALHAELDSVLEDRPLTAADYPRLPYTRAVLAESMRLFPPAWTIGREPLEDVELGGYRIRRGSIVLMSPWVMHRDGRYFPDPLDFQPRRWLEGLESELPRFTYFPFGAGPRKCIGEGFAWMEGVLVLATLARRWRATLLPEAQIEPLPLITLRLRNGAPMRLHRRRQQL